MTKKENFAKGITWGLGLLFILFVCMFAIHAVQLDIAVNREYQGHFGLAQHSGSPAAIADSLETYLEKVEQGIENGDIDRFGYTTLFYKTPENQIAGQIKVVESFIERANDLDEQRGLENIAPQIALGTLKQDMEYRHISIWCHKIYEGNGFYVTIELILWILFLFAWILMKIGNDICCWYW